MHLVRHVSSGINHSALRASLQSLLLHKSIMSQTLIHVLTPVLLVILKTILHLHELNVIQIVKNVLQMELPQHVLNVMDQINFIMQFVTPPVLTPQWQRTKAAECAMLVMRIVKLVLEVLQLALLVPQLTYTIALVLQIDLVLSWRLQMSVLLVTQIV